MLRGEYRENTDMAVIMDMLVLVSSWPFYRPSLVYPVDHRVYIGSIYNRS